MSKKLCLMSAAILATSLSFAMADAVDELSKAADKGQLTEKFLCKKGDMGEQLASGNVIQFFKSALTPESACRKGNGALVKASYEAAVVCWKVCGKAVLTGTKAGEAMKTKYKWNGDKIENPDDKKMLTADDALKAIGLKAAKGPIGQKIMGAVCKSEVKGMVAMGCDVAKAKLAG